MPERTHISSLHRAPPPEILEEGSTLTMSLPADILTPVSAYLSLRTHSKGSFLFESVEGGEHLARYSFIGIDPAMVIESGGGSVTVTRDDRLVRSTGDIFTTIRDILVSNPPTEESLPPPFSGGLVGYIGYDEVRAIEKIPCSVTDSAGAPDSMLCAFKSVLVFDHRDHKINIVSVIGTGERSDAITRLTSIRDILRRPVTTGSNFQPQWKGADTPEVPADFDRNVETALEHIRSGDIFQVVLSCRNTVPYDGDPFAVYRSLRMINPSPYHYYLDFGKVQLIGSSPEMLVKKTGSRIQHMPIAGTRRRGLTPVGDAAAASELFADEKERAEHTMLVDLGRNDLSRVCQAGSVKTESFMKVEMFSHVMHLVSRVAGNTRPGIDSVDILRAVFPAGTVSGAPKIRAMEIIDELEEIRRGFYAGAVGYFDRSGNLDFCIAIRTMMAFDGVLHLQAGAGIVSGSVPSREREEIVNKMSVLFEAIRQAEGIDR